MNLTIAERLVFSTLYPAKGNLMELILIKDLSSKVDFSIVELEKYEIKNTQTNLFTWNSQKAEEKNIELSKSEIQFLKNRVDILDKEQNLTLNILNLCLKIKEL